MDGATNSFGTGFDSNNGGVYATLLDSSGIKVWFFPRSRIPADITSGRPTLSVSQWGTPQANFQFGSSCNVPQRFKNQTIGKGSLSADNQVPSGALSCFVK